MNSLVDSLHRDLQYALRQTRRSPGFASVAILCLGLGIGVNTTIFSVITATLLRPSAVEHPEQLVLVSRGERTAWPYPIYRDFQDRTRSLSALTASFPMESDLDVDGESEFVTAEVVPANYGVVLGVKPLLGRWFDDDTEPGAVISYAVWQRRFALDPDVIGRRIASQSESYTIVGVAPRAFVGAFVPLRTDIWVPIRTRAFFATRLDDRDNPVRMPMLFGRLRAGTTAGEASAELNAIDAQLSTEYSSTQPVQPPIIAEPVRGVLNPILRRLAGPLATSLAVIVGVILLIACVNVGNLLLIRGALRQREFVVRRALGATRGRLLRQLLLETLVLAAAGGTCGVVLAMWTNALLERTLPPFFGAFEVQLDLSLDWRAIAFATATSLVTTILCGLLPAWRSSRTHSLVAFTNEIGGGTSRRRPLGLVAQVVMSLVLLFVAGSVLQGLIRLLTTDPGFVVDGRLYAYTFIPSPPFTPESRREFYARALDQVRALPGVQSAASTSTLPLMPTGSDCASVAGGTPIRITSSSVDAGYFDTMGIPTIAGRDLGALDRSTDVPAVVVSEGLARRLWPTSSPIGQPLMMGCDAAAQPAVLVGVVGNSAINGLDEIAQPHLYRSIRQEQSHSLIAIVVKTKADPATMVLPLRRTLLALGQGIRVYSVQPLSTHVEQRYAPSRWLVAVITIFGGLALALAAIGLYGVIAYRVALRTQEIGVRMALGAGRHDIFRDVLRYGLAIVLVGVAIGEVFTVALTGVVASMQTGIAPTSLSTHLIVALIWIAVALAACYLPARRAARVDPLVALRHL